MEGASRMTEKQWQLLYQSLLGLTGPLAKFISLFFDLNQDDVKTKLDAALTLLAVVTPLISTVWVVFTNKPVDQIKSVATLPPDQLSNAAAAIPPETLASFANVLPDKAIVTAAGNLEGVNVVVGDTASRGAMQAATDPGVPGVNRI